VVTIFMTVFLVINVVISVYNWDDEVTFIRICHRDNLGWKTFLGAICLFVLDFAVTGASATLFGIGTGVVGSAVTIFMSNLLSAVFLIPRPYHMEMVKAEHRKNDKRRWIWFRV
jgi:hypothetical protein